METTISGGESIGVKGRLKKVQNLQKQVSIMEVVEEYLNVKDCHVMPVQTVRIQTCIAIETFLNYYLFLC